MQFKINNPEYLYESLLYLHKLFREYSIPKGKKEIFEMPPEFGIVLMIESCKKFKQVPVVNVIWNAFI